MNNFPLFIMCVVILFGISSCVKKKNEQLAQTHFKKGFLELSDQANSDRTGQQKALSCVEKALDQCEKSEYCAFKGTLLFKMGDYKKSEQSFQKALMLQDDSSLKAEILNNYACLLAQRGEIVKAKEIWNKLKDDPYYQTPQVALVNLGKIYVEARRFVEAKQFFEEACHLAPGYLDSHFYLALVAFQLGQSDLANKKLDMVLLQEPKHEGALYCAKMFNPDKALVSGLFN